MNIEQLIHFREVTQSGSYLIVAQKFFISEEVIRESINSLENELGFKLFKCYNDSKFVLSFEGLQIISLVKEVFMNYQAIEEKVKSIKNNSYVDGGMMYEVSIL